ncbi:MAG: hypothetical protein AB7S98_25120, partial [Burkholderiaceae bacterium]
MVLLVSRAWDRCRAATSGWLHESIRRAHSPEDLALHPEDGLAIVVFDHRNDTGNRIGTHPRIV